MANAESSKLDRYKLETTFDGDEIIHTIYTSDLATGQRRIEVTEKWRRKKKIGAGAFGIIWLEEETGGKVRAVKTLPRNIQNIDCSRELATLAKLKDHHQLFVQLFGWYESEECIHVAMEYMKYGDLAKYLQTPNARSDAREITRQLLEGLCVLHGNKISHRDLKPQNILVASLQPIWVKIADFGLSKREKGTFLHTSAGTSAYCAPEILRLLPQEFRSRNTYTNAVDMWALGCLVHEILTLETPFLESEFDDTIYFEMEFCERQPDMGMIHKFCSGQIDFPTEVLQQSKVEESGIDFVKKLLVPNPRFRISAKDALTSPWLLETPRQENRKHQIKMDQVLLQSEEDLFLQDCHDHLVRFVRPEEPGLINFFSKDLNETLRPYSRQAGKLAIELRGMGCTKGIACSLGLLTLYDLVILIDDCTTARAKIYTDMLRKFLYLVVEIYGLAGDGGIKSIRFVNHHKGKGRVGKGDVENIMGRMSLGGISRIGTELHRKILIPFVLGSKEKPIVMKKPLLVMVITTADVEGERKGLLKDVIINTHATLKKRGVGGIHSVAFQFSNLVESLYALQMLTSLADHPQIGLNYDHQSVHDVVDDKDGTGKNWREIGKLFLGPLLPIWR